MKIGLYYRVPFEFGGVETSMYNRGKLFTKMGHEVTYIFKECRSLDTLEKWSEIGNVIQEDYCNEVFDILIYDAIYQLPKLKAKKRIQIFNNNLIDMNEKYNVKFNINDNVAVSEECAKQVKEMLGKDCTIIPNVIDEDLIKSKMLDHYDYKKAKYNFVVVGRFDENKGQHKLINFIKEIHNKTKDYQLIFVGSNESFPNYYNKMKDLYKGYNVLFVGKQDNPYKFMYNADVVLIPSTSESQCLVLDEALICGTPVVSTDFEVAKTKINKENGILVDKDFKNYDLKAILELKKGFEYKYPSQEKKWEEMLKISPKRDYKFSIIIPNYNNAKWLDRCLGSVLNQTYKNYEIIFIDDVSEDNSVELAKKIIGNKQPSMIIPLDHKRYNGGARNVGILEATGDYILCIDSDDTLDNENVLKTINDNLNDEDVMFLGFDLYDGQKKGLYPFIPNYESLDDAFENAVVAIWTKVVKTDIMKECLFKEGTLMEDKVQHFRVCDTASTFSCLKEITHNWNRSNTTSVTTKRDYRWNNCVYRYLADLLDFAEETKNERHKQYVKARIEALKQDINAGQRRQL